MRKKRGFFQEYIFQVIFSNGGSSVSDSDSKFSSAFNSMNSSNSAKSFSSRMVPSMEWRISLPSSRRASKSSSKISVKKRSSKDNGNFTVLFHFENNKINREGLSVSRDNFEYKEYGMRLMLALRSAKALHEKALLKLLGMRKLLLSPSFGGTLF
ncbi:hypothetical protein Tco_0076860 [Tanacetum coccineum]